MKYHIVLKILAVLLAACGLFTAVLAGAGIIVLYEADLWDTTPETYLTSLFEDHARVLAHRAARSYAIRLLGGWTEEEISAIEGFSSYQVSAPYYNYVYSGELDESLWGYKIIQKDTVLEQSANVSSLPNQAAYTFSITTTYWERVDPARSSYFRTVYSDYLGYSLYYRSMTAPTYQVTIVVDMEQVPLSTAETLLMLANQQKMQLPFLTVAGLVLFFACFIYLMCAAGRTKTGDLAPRGLNLLPLDIYAAGVFFLFVGGCVLLEELFYSFGYTQYSYQQVLILVLMVLCCLGLEIVFLGFFMALAAQLKRKNLYWLRHTLVGICVRFLYRSVRWLIRKGKRLFLLLPFFWQRAVVILGLLFSALLMLLGFSYGRIFTIFLLLTPLWWISVIAYDLYGFGILMRGAKRMAAGDLGTQIPTGNLLGVYKDHAKALNAMADVATVAAQRQMKSERMKAELITNVSHDIKTPLTSIINYVDLMQQPHTPEEESQYLEVLARQSLRMKKLLEDLLEMSKASTGNMAVSITQLNAVEAVNQALGEFSDKLSAAQLAPVLVAPDNPVFIQADGRITWRVLSNLLSNVVKYALPGTRVYLMLEQTGSVLTLSVKNISRDPLNVSADELTERFVRGDQARNSEGSGLGLNIARSLMELQKGKLELTVDGDLFKVTLTFPKSETK